MRIVEKRRKKLEADEKRKFVVIRGLQKNRRGLEKEIEEFFKTML